MTHYYEKASIDRREREDIKSMKHYAQISKFLRENGLDLPPVPSKDELKKIIDDFIDKYLPDNPDNR